MNAAQTLVWEPLLTPWGLGLLLLSLVAALVLAGASTRGLAVGRRWSLTALRLLSAVVVFVIALGPAGEERQERVARAPLVVLLDSSRSMSVQEDGISRAERLAAWWGGASASPELQGADVEVIPFRFDEALASWAPPTAGSASPVDGRTTDLGAALLGLREALGGRKPTAVLVASDGADRGALLRAFTSNGTDGVRTALSGLSAPISTWTVAGGAAVTDLRVDVPTPPPFGFVRRPVTVEATITGRGRSWGTVPVSVSVEGELRDVQDVTLNAEGNGTLSLSFRPDRVGPHTVSFSVPVAPADAIPTNNRVDVTVKIVRDRTRVLQITARPSWDVKYLRGLLKSDPNLDLVSFFILRGESRRAPLVGGAQDLTLIPFPADDLFGQDLQGFDLVIFQNFSFNGLPDMPSDEYLAHVVQYVRQGGALLLIGGDAAFGEGDWGRGPLAEILPARVSAARPPGSSYRAVLTEAGRRHPVTRLVADAEANVPRWASLPLLAGWNPLEELAPGAVPLLLAGPDGPPLLVARGVGRGRVLAFATDTSWKWALRGAGIEGADDHATFWRSALRWLVRDVEEQQVTLSVDRENVPAGEQVGFQVRVLQEDYAPRAGVEIVGTVGPLGGKVGTPLAGKTDADGLWSTSLLTTTPGTLRIEVAAPSVPQPFDSAMARVSVIDRDPELLEPDARPDLLAAIAEVSGGRAFVGPGPSLRELPRREVPVPHGEDRRRHPLWNHPWVLLAVALPWVAEWILRRRLGLR